MLDENGNEIQETLKKADELTDDTNILLLDDIDTIFDRDDMDHDRFAELSLQGKQEILWKDIKVKTEKDVIPETKDDEELEDEPKPEIPEPKSAEEIPVKEEVIEDKTGKTAAAKDKTDKQTFIIDENLIKTEVDKFRETNKDNPNLVKMVEDYQGILNGVKDEVMSPKVLRNYINSQLYIKNVKPNPLDPKWQPDKKVTTDPDYLAKAVEAKNKLIADNMRSIFKDFPPEAITDPEIEKEYLKELQAEDPRAFFKYEKQLEIIQKNVNESYDRFRNLRDNWEPIAADSIKVEVAKFNSILAGLNLTPEEVGIPSLELDDKYRNDFLYQPGNVLFKKDGSVNENVIGFIDNDIPFIKPNAVFAELVSHFTKAMMAKATEKGRVEGYNIGKDAIPEPNMADSGAKGEKDSLEVNLDFDDDSKSPEELESNFAKWTNKLFNSGKRK
jgi:hypothetical protein